MPSRPTFYAILAVAALVALFAVSARGNQKMLPITADSSFSVSKILGLTDSAPAEQSAGSFVERMIQSGADSAKDVASQKVIEAKNTMIESLKKEVTRLTDAQVKQLTTQLCKDWGVISSSSSATSSAN